MPSPPEDHRFQSSPLHAILDVDVAAAAGWAPADLAEAFLDGGARFVQVRAKHLGSAAFLRLCDDVLARARPHGATVIVNDRVDLARMSGAAGVHVGQDDLPPASARDLLGPDAVVGYSTHSLSQVEGALLQPVSYIAVGPVFGTTTKDTGYSAVGLAFVSDASARAGVCPIVAIGGITLDRAAEVMTAGASAVAVISDLLATGNPSQRTRAYLQRLEQYRV